MKQPPQGNGQQGTGGIGSGQATSTPDQHGRQPHLGSKPDTDSAPGGTGQNDGERFEDTTPTDSSAKSRHVSGDRDIGAHTPGGTGDLLSQPQGDGNYIKQGDRQTPLAGTPDLPAGND